MSIKIAVLGMGAVGKTSLTLRFISGYFVDDYEEVVQEWVRIMTVNGVEQRVEVLDTDGQQEYSPQRDRDVQRADGFLLVYSTTSHQTLLDVGEMRDRIYRELDREHDEGIPIVLVGNKCDLEAQRRVERVEAAGIASEWGVPFMEVSAKLGINVEEAFETAIREALRFKGASACESATAPVKKQRLPERGCFVQ